LTFVKINAGQQNGQQMVNKWSTNGQQIVVRRNGGMAITVGKYHLFERERRGSSFFYYWYEEQGRRIQKACGHGCDDKQAAVALAGTASQS
jgi:hypothetical protein